MEALLAEMPLAWKSPVLVVSETIVAVKHRLLLWRRNPAPGYPLVSSYPEKWPLALAMETMRAMLRMVLGLRSTLPLIHAMETRVASTFFRMETEEAVSSVGIEDNPELEISTWVQEAATPQVLVPVQVVPSARTVAMETSRAPELEDQWVQVAVILPVPVQITVEMRLDRTAAIRTNLVLELVRRLDRTAVTRLARAENSRDSPLDQEAAMKKAPAMTFREMRSEMAAATLLDLALASAVHLWHQTVVTNPTPVLASMEPPSARILVIAPAAASARILDAKIYPTWYRQTFVISPEIVSALPERTHLLHPARVPMPARTLLTCAFDRTHALASGLAETLNLSWLEATLANLVSRARMQII